MNDPSRAIVMEETPEPNDLSEALERRERHRRNVAWLEAHAAEVYSQHRGKFICIAGQELFVADTPRQALALARASHLDDDGCYLRYIPREKVARIYAYS